MKEDNFLISGDLLPTEELINLLQSLASGQIVIDQSAKFIMARLNQTSTESVLPILWQDNFVELASGYNIMNSTLNIERISNLWDLFNKNGNQIKIDYSLLTNGKQSNTLSNDNRSLGNEIFIEEGATVRCSILNSLTGPIYISRGAEIMEGSTIRGPFALGEQATIKMGAKIYGPTTIGPHCKVGGEVNNSVLQANSNKAHDGFLGNAVIGEWCNIGADTNNSNLKNTYTEVKLWNYSTNNFIPTGSIFCGLIMGDHAKCGINTMFNTGTVVGVAANVFGSGYPRQFIPDFSWGGSSGFKTFKFEDFLKTAEVVMARRNVKLEAEYKIMLENFFNESSIYRTWEK